MARSMFRKLDRDIGEAALGGKPGQISQEAKADALGAYSDSIHNIPKPTVKRPGENSSCSLILIGLVALPPITFFGIEAVKHFLN